MKKAIILTSLLLSIACEQSSHEAHETSIENANYYQSTIRYMRDKQTNLCFAFLNMGPYHSRELTHVPCTPEVEKLIAK